MFWRFNLQKLMLPSIILILSCPCKFRRHSESPDSPRPSQRAKICLYHNFICTSSFNLLCYMYAWAWRWRPIAPAAAQFKPNFPLHILQFLNFIDWALTASICWCMFGKWTMWNLSRLLLNSFDYRFFSNLKAVNMKFVQAIYWCFRVYFCK